jgi:hypothetical protein
MRRDMLVAGLAILAAILPRALRNPPAHIRELMVVRSTPLKCGQFWRNAGAKEPSLWETM